MKNILHRGENSLKKEQVATRSILHKHKNNTIVVSYPNIVRNEIFLYNKINYDEVIEDIHNSWLYCFTNPLELGTQVKQYNQELCISSKSRCFIKGLQSRPLK